MNALKISYQEVIDHIAADIETLKQSGQIADTASSALLRERREWLICRRDRLNEQRKQVISGFNERLEAYMFLCERFWKGKHERTYEKRLAQLHEAKQRVVKIHSLTGFDACHALSCLP